MENPEPVVVIPAPEINPRYFYKVIDRENPLIDFSRLFLDVQDALVHALLTIPDLLPISLKNVTITQIQQTLMPEQGEQFRFPNSDKYRLAQYRLYKPLTYYHRIRTAAENEADTAAQKVVGSMDDRIFRTGLITVNYQTNIQQGIDWNRIFKIVEDTGRGIPIGEPEYMIRGINITNRYLSVSPISIYPVHWKNIWKMFLINNIQTPGLESALKFFRESMSQPGVIKAMLGEHAAPGYDDCLPGIFGYQNPGTSCFMDSTMMCMFAFKNSPFVDNLLGRGLVPGPGYATCSQDPVQETALRQKVYNRTKLDYQTMAMGAKTLCSGLRITLGKECNISGNPEDDFSQQMADPAEMYIRLLTILNYHPIEYARRTMRATDANGTGQTVSNEVTQKSTMLPPLRADDQSIEEISWPGSWNMPYENVHSGGADTFSRSEYRIISADVIVVHLDRGLTGMEAEIPVAKVESPTASPFASFLNPLPLFPGPTNPAFIVPPWANTRRVKVKQTFNVNGNVYDLRAVVYSPSDRHYGALLKCGAGWFAYDDQDVGIPLSQKVISPEAANELIETRGTLLFYYPPFPKISAADQYAASEVIKRLASVRIGPLPRR